MILRKIFNFLFFVFVLGMTSCSNDFQITEGSVEIPVVYGMISANESATYIRVERAFVDEKTSAFILSKDPAQLYFDNISVYIKHVKSGTEYELSRVDGNLEGLQREEGAFADAPNYLYKINQSQLKFIPKDEYKLIVRRNDGTLLTDASAIALTPLDDTKGDVNPKIASIFNFSYVNDFKVNWFTDENAVIHDVNLIIYFSETKNGVTEDKSQTWSMVSNYTIKSGSTNNYTLSVNGRRFYEFLYGALDKDITIKRKLKTVSLQIKSGGQPIKDYLSFGLANLGITSSGEIPIYTNLSNESRGIFSSKTEFLRNDIELTNITLDSLKNGIITKSLNFQ